MHLTNIRAPSSGLPQTHLSKHGVVAGARERRRRHACCPAHRDAAHRPCRCCWCCAIGWHAPRLLHEVELGARGLERCRHRRRRLRGGAAGRLAPAAHAVSARLDQSFGSLREGRLGFDFCFPPAAAVGACAARGLQAIAPDHAIASQGLTQPTGRAVGNGLASTAVRLLSASNRYWVVGARPLTAQRADRATQALRMGRIGRAGHLLALFRLSCSCSALTLD